MQKMFFVGFLVALYFVSVGQSKHTLLLGVNNATGEFANKEKGGCGLGFGAGYQFSYAFTEFGLGVFAGIDYFNNPTSKDTKEYYEELFAPIILSHYFVFSSIPVSVGLNFTQQGSGNVRFIANGGITYNTLIVSSLEGTYNNEKFDIDISANGNIGFKIDAGVLIKNLFTINVGYYGLGKHNATQGVDYAGQAIVPPTDYEENVSFFTLRLGVMLGN